MRDSFQALDESLVLQLALESREIAFSALKMPKMQGFSHFFSMFDE